MRKTISKEIEKNAPFIAIFILVLFFHIFFYQRSRDELTIYNAYFEQYGVMSLTNCWKFIIDKMRITILQWSSRTIIDFVSLVLIFAIPVWMFVNAAMYAIFVKSLCFILGFTNKLLIILVCAAITLAPQSMYLTAGWLMTSIAYFWPVVLATVCIAILLKPDTKLELWEKIVAVGTVLYAANEEIMSIVLLTILFFVAYNRSDRRKICVLLECIVVTELLWAVLCPGNQSRGIQELSWFLDYSSLTIIKKMELGFSSTMNEFLLRANSSFLILNFIIAALGKRKKLYWEQRFIVNFPFISSMGSVLVQLFSNKVEKFSVLYNSESKYGSISLYNYDNYGAYLPLVFYIFTGGCILLSILIIGQYSKRSFAIAVVLLTGVAARCAMGFSPTVWASGRRTFSILYYLIVFIILIGVKKILITKNKVLIEVTSMMILVGSMYETCKFIMCF